MTIDQAMSVAFGRHQSGQLDAAEQIYRQILGVSPNHPDALHYMGVLCIQRSQFPHALDWMRKAVQFAPSDPGIRRELGVALFETGNHAQGIAECEISVQLNPGSAANHNNLGGLLIRAGQSQRAIECFLNALKINPAHAEALANLGNACQELNRLDEAVEFYRKSLAVNPNAANVHFNLAAAHKKKGDHDGAMTEYEATVRLEPRYCRALNNLAEEYLDRKRMREAAELYRRAVAIDPSNAIMHNNLGIALQELGFYEQSVDAYKKALSLRPDLHDILNNLGIVLYRIGELDEAVGCFTKALRHQPQNAKLHNNLGNAYKNLGQHAQSIACYRKSIELEPDFPDPWSNLLLGQLYMPDFNPADYARDLARWNERIIRPIPRRHAHPNDRSPDRKLKIAFLSPDFKEHPVCRFVICLLNHLDRARHEVFLYHDTPRVDPTTLLIKPLADHWRETPGLTDDQLDQLIRDDRIDILFDLAAHTGNNRLKVFARKPAPVQITWLAYCGTTGLDAFDCRLSDRLIDPPGMFDSQYAEKTVYLSRSYWCYHPPDGVPEPVCPPFPAAFCCLNNFCKMNPPLLDAFAEILNLAPDSSLLLHAEAGSHRDRVAQHFSQKGVNPSRIRFARRTSIVDYFSLYNQCHIALDPFPFNGGTTSCDALYMGVPVVSRVSADRAMGRAGKTLLENLGHSEWLADSTEQYIQIALDLAHDFDRVSSLKQSLRDQMKNSPLMDAPGFASEIGSILRSLWMNWINHDPR